MAGMLSISPSDAAGTLPLAMSQQHDINGQPVQCQITFYVAGTPAQLQNEFQDFGLTQAGPNPLSCDATGRVPMFWLADGLIHVRMTDNFGTPIIDTTMQVLGPSSGGGGGGGTVDPTAILSTGDLKFKYATGPLSGFVRLNALTIGSATSGATERANADTQALFIYLYGVDSSLVVSGGRSGNALNDFNANKTLTLPDWRGRVPVALDDMGNSAAGRLTGAGFGATGTTLGLSGGGETETLTLAQLPTGINVTGSVTVQVGGGNVVPIAAGLINEGVAPGGGLNVPGSGSNTFSSQSSFTGTGQSMASNNTSGGSHPIVQPSMLATFYIKL